MIDVFVEDVAFGGRGVARHEGKAVFIPFTIDGERVNARITRNKKNFAEGVLEKVIERSPHRVAPVCPYFQKCGGCSYQHIAYEHQLEIKERQVGQTLRRVGNLQHVPVHPIIPSPKYYAYRNRVRVHANNGVVGFYALESHDLVDIESCPIASREVNDALVRLRGKSLLDGDYNAAENNGGKFFEQTNQAVASKMLDLVGTLVKQGQGLLVDAYCGAGFFAKHLRSHFKGVVGIEENELAVDCARRDALQHENYIFGPVEIHLPHTLAEAEGALTTLILDPPATGLTSRVIDQILVSMPVEIIYVSCNPATLARDLRHLGTAYGLLSVSPLDMFPQTAEIECVAHLRK
jgi:23S rRNA (uracil1939-C5)-methyltransferase